ncbi:hypothetical protein LINPERHAP2_LOCUS31925 [Linum perenne]
MRRRTFTGIIMLIMSTNSASPIQILAPSPAGRLATDSCGSWIVGRVWSLRRIGLTTIVGVPMMLKLSSKIARFGSR